MSIIRKKKSKLWQIMKLSQNYYWQNVIYERKSLNYDINFDIIS